MEIEEKNVSMDLDEIINDIRRLEVLYQHCKSIYYRYKYRYLCCSSKKKSAKSHKNSVKKDLKRAREELISRSRAIAKEIREKEVEALEGN